jgi:uncharacterized protein with NRDE domain
MPYSGEYGFIETEMYWPVNHMVSPKENSLSCAECHTREDGRLAALTNFYLPGRDNNPWIDNMGLLLIIFSLAGVLIHGGFRIFSNLRNQDYQTLNIESGELK